MQDIVKQVTTLVLGGVIVGLIMLFAERDFESGPEVRILVQDTALHSDFLTDVIRASVNHLDSESLKDEERISNERLDEITATLIDASGIRFGGALTTYYIANISEDEAYSLKILSREIEFATISGVDTIETDVDQIDTSIRVLPGESAYLSVVYRSNSSLKYPDVSTNGNVVFFFINDKPVVPIKISNFDSFDTDAERAIKGAPLFFGFLSIFGVVFLALILIAGVLQLIFRDRASFVTFISSAKELAIYKIAIEKIYREDQEKSEKITLEAEKILGK